MEDFDSVLKKLDKLKIFYDKGKTDTDLLWYISGLSKIFHQGQIDNVMSKKTYDGSTYTDKHILEFSINLKKKIITLTFQACYYFYYHDQKKITCSGSNWCWHDNSKQLFCTLDKRHFYEKIWKCLTILPLDNVIEVYRYSKAMLKHLPQKSLEMLAKNYFIVTKRLF